MINFEEISDNIIDTKFKYKKITPKYSNELKSIFLNIEKELILKS